MKQPNAYTIGNVDSYPQAIADGVHKLGKHGDYEGGSVWRTEAEALTYLQAWEREAVEQFGASGMKFDVYGLYLPNGWEQDVHRIPGETYHRLLVNAEILSLNKSGEQS